MPANMLACGARKRSSPEASEATITEETPHTEPSTAPGSKTTRVRAGAVIAIAIAAALIAWLLLRGGGHKTSTPTTTPTAPTFAGGFAHSVNGMKILKTQVGHTVYWAGPKPGFGYEMTVTQDGRVYVRYLPAGVQKGDPRSIFLVVATYPFPNAFQALKNAGGAQVTLKGGGVAVFNSNTPQSVHLAYPGVDYQVEVFDHLPAVARDTALKEIRAVP